MEFNSTIFSGMARQWGKTVATPLSRGAGVVTSFVKADGIMALPQDSEGYGAGEKMRVRLLRPYREIEHSLAGPAQEGRRLGALEFDRTLVVVEGDALAMEAFMFLFALRFMSAGGGDGVMQTPKTWPADKLSVNTVVI